MISGSTITIVLCGLAVAFAGLGIRTGSADRESVYFGLALGLAVAAMLEWLVF